MLLPNEQKMIDAIENLRKQYEEGADAVYRKSNLNTFNMTGSQRNNYYNMRHEGPGNVRAILAELKACELALEAYRNAMRAQA